jgi:hypothetical protein
LRQQVSTPIMTIARGQEWKDHKSRNTREMEAKSIIMTETDNIIIGTWSRSPERKVSISVSALTHTTSSESIRCCLAPVPIDCKLECVVLGVSPTERLPVSTLVRSS